eukprot:CAMPEP_0182449230 /NCGR_PEP_ID=MMETSP1172-20130603/32623_1 /TAXON_ID=708627 /ORGANISM="Timspurckia oligopyrenoides, Strain CCMP3278" /LENGTH=88 /DNA_ID=CAMNT_0024646409 /DNA_START=12 /DNA_END=275 /DNA_ORIENTATION=+
MRGQLERIPIGKCWDDAVFDLKRAVGYESRRFLYEAEIRQAVETQRQKLRQRLTLKRSPELNAEHIDAIVNRYEIIVLDLRVDTVCDH